MSAAEKQFMDLFRNGDEEAFREVYEMYFHALCRFTVRYVRDNEVTADIVQDVFVCLLRTQGNFYSAVALRTFLYVTARNRAINYLRRTRMIGQRIRHIETDMLVAEEAAFSIEAETWRLLDHSMQRLPDKCREILELSLDGKSYKEIGLSLNMAVNTVRNQRARAIKLLRYFYENVL